MSLVLQGIPARCIPREDWAAIRVHPWSTAGGTHGIQRAELEDQIAELRQRVKWMSEHGGRLAGTDWYWSILSAGRIGKIRILSDYLCGATTNAAAVARHIGGRWRKVGHSERGVWHRETEIDGVLIQIALGE